MFSELQRNPELAFGEAGVQTDAGRELGLFKDRDCFLGS